MMVDFAQKAQAPALAFGPAVCERIDLADMIHMTLIVIYSNFLFLFARLASASAAVCAPLNHRSGDFRYFLN
jgi:hypothetical protein